jgi:anthraniloyl-CoA monooxygenase
LRIRCIGGGPASLYFALLARQALPGAEVEVVERNRADDTFGWGVVFSDETLGHFEEADPESYAEMKRLMRAWTDIDTWVGGERVTSTGHGFCGLSRKRLLQAFHERCRAVGVTLRFETEVKDVQAARRDVDLLVGGDGVQSAVRAAFEDRFRPTIEWGACRFSWLGTTLPLDAFTFVFRESEHGLFVVHAYPFEPGLSTWIVECREETWRRSGLDRASEEDTVRFVERLFADRLGGHRILANKSIWRRFPTLTCESWGAGDVVLLGDSAHTAHFSIGSGTKIAMEDSIALAKALADSGGDVAKALLAYEAERRPQVERVQRAAATSRAWFESAERWRRQTPVRLAFNCMTRSHQITYDNLARRDPALVARVRAEFAAEAGAAPREDGTPPPPCLVPFRVRSLVLPNRIVVSPMCQYSAVDGVVGDWHLVHLGSRAVGGAGLVFGEMTDVSPEGRITPGCAGLWNEAHVEAWRRIVDFVHGNTHARIGLQIAHAGRKGSCSVPWEGDAPLEGSAAWTTLAPSAIPWDEGWPAPKAMDRKDLDLVRTQFASAAERARRAGFDALEIHMAHGYLLSSFLSPLSNRRTDDYGGSLENRLRFPLEVLRAVRGAWGADLPLFVRISAHDWMPDGSGLLPADAVEIAKALAAHGCDVVDVSSGGTSPAGRPVYGRMYQAPFADRIRHEAGVPVMSVGGIGGFDHANTLLAAGRADLCAIARAHLVNPYLALGASVAYGWPEAAWPHQYGPAKPRPLASPATPTPVPARPKPAGRRGPASQR